MVMKIKLMTFSAENSTEQATNSSNNGAYQTNEKPKIPNILRKLNAQRRRSTTKERSRKSNDKTIVNINNNDSVSLEWLQEQSWRKSSCLLDTHRQVRKFLCHKFNILFVMQFSEQIFFSVLLCSNFQFYYCCFNFTVKWNFYSEFT